MSAARALAIVCCLAGLRRLPAQAADPVQEARHLALAGHRAAASALLDRLLSTQPGNVDALVMSIYVDLWSGKLADAERRSSEALALHPSDVDLLLARAV